MAPRPKSPHLYLEEDHGYRTPCWIWQRAKNSAGYGVLRQGQKLVLAHRHFFTKRYGPIPKGRKLDHQCEQTLCVRPSHLQPVTHAENIRRGRSAKLTHAAVRVIRAELACGTSAVAVARRHGVNEHTIRQINHGRAWT